MKILNQQFIVCFTAVMLLPLCSTVFAQDFNFSSAGDGNSWEDIANWTQDDMPSAFFPSTMDDNVTITGAGEVVNFDADSWMFAETNALLTGGATGEFRIRQLRMGTRGNTTINFDYGDGNVFRSTQGTTYTVGAFSGSEGTINVISGDVRLDTSNFRLAERVGAIGNVSVGGPGNPRLIIGRGDNNGISMRVGSPDGSVGTFEITNGRFRTRSGVSVGPMGMFRVLGSSVVEVEIGDEGNLDGIWQQDAGGTLEYQFDAGGVTQINVADNDLGDGTAATFAAGSLLDLSFQGAPTDGTWILMQVENGAITDNGLALTADTDAGWSFAIDNSGVNGVLTATFSSGGGADCPSGFARGDVNTDGTIDLLDVNLFVNALLTGQQSCEADVNGDGIVDLLDVTPFVDILLGN